MKKRLTLNELRLLVRGLVTEYVANDDANPHKEAHADPTGKAWDTGLDEADDDLDEADDVKWWKDPELNDIDGPRYMPFDERWAKMAEEPEYKPFIDAIKGAADPKELARAKRAILKAQDEGQTDISDGMWGFFYKKRQTELRDMQSQSKSMADPSKSAADARMDRMLRTRDSSGKATPRKF